MLKAITNFRFCHPKKGGAGGSCCSPASEPSTRPWDFNGLNNSSGPHIAK
jgi:hypothetical protein